MSGTNKVEESKMTEYVTVFNIATNEKHFPLKKTWNKLAFSNLNNEYKILTGMDGIRPTIKEDKSFVYREGEKYEVLEVGLNTVTLKSNIITSSSFIETIECVKDHYTLEPPKPENPWITDPKEVVQYLGTEQLFEFSDDDGEFIKETGTLRGVSVSGTLPFESKRWWSEMIRKVEA